MDLCSSKKHALSSDRHALADIEGVVDLRRMIRDAPAPAHRLALISPLKISDAFAA
jgi:hypothetical protein